MKECVMFFNYVNDKVLDNACSDTWYVNLKAMPVKKIQFYF